MTACATPSATAAIEPTPEGAQSATHLTLRLDPLVELYFSVRAQAARPDSPPPAGQEPAIDAARRIQAVLGAFGGWGPFDSEVFTAGDAATLVRRFEALPETMERAGRTVALRGDAIALAQSLTALSPQFLERSWPERRRTLEALVAGLGTSFLPRHRSALAQMASSLGIDDPGIEVPVVLVTDCHPPGASTYHLDAGQPASVIGAPALAARGQLEETILHEATHGLDLASKGGGSAFESMRSLLAQRGVTPRDRLYQDAPHALMFVQAAETMRRIYDPAHVPYGVSSGVYSRLGRPAEVARRVWPQVLDGTLARDEAVRRIVDELVPPPPPAPAPPPG